MELKIRKGAESSTAGILGTFFDVESADIVREGVERFITKDPLSDDVILVLCLMFALGRAWERYQTSDLSASDCTNDLVN